MVKKGKHLKNESLLIAVQKVLRLDTIGGEGNPQGIVQEIKI